MSLLIVMAVCLAFVWMFLTSQVNGQGFVLGFGLSLVILYSFRQRNGKVRWRRLPAQILGFLYYLLILYRDIFFSSLDIASKVLSPGMNLSPGVVAVPIQDPDSSELMAALSANAISLTPGELVVEIKDNSVLYIHTLDVDRTASRAANEQAERVQLLNRILGRN